MRPHLRRLDLYLLAFDLGAVELRYDAVGVFGHDIDKQVPLANIHRAKNVGGQAGFAMTVGR
jgi:hypothetical protein